MTDTEATEQIEDSTKAEDVQSGGETIGAATRESWSTGQSIGAICAVVSVFVIMLGIATWPINSAWGWWPWPECASCKPFSGLWSYCEDAARDGIISIITILGGTTLFVSSWFVWLKS